MGKEQELLEAARTGNLAAVEKLLSGKRQSAGSGAAGGVGSSGNVGSGGHSSSHPLSSLLSGICASRLVRRIHVWHGSAPHWERQAQRVSEVNKRVIVWSGASRRQNKRMFSCLSSLSSPLLSGPKIFRDINLYLLSSG
ncbi:hypothetical protein E1301_Tti002122 [Triplophysa tibetana]|uniref:Uncharacterized protein n=1 Tax=Triplophysa tibetana TaxID=1572043 RepID=A0A5A9N9X4_9TELE|nr:hypothetical protein E1301_Tti002122 [Triplophysa tibetana]